MDNFSFDEILQVWGSEGRKAIQKNFRHFRVLLESASRYATAGELDLASVYASIAAFHASARHCGVWASPELERVLVDIGKRIDSSRPASTRREGPARAQKIFHVASAVLPVGGLTRMLARWIKEDRDRQHTLVLTRQATQEVPAFLVEAVTNSGGRVHLIDATVGGLIERAKALRRVIAQADLIVLHVHPYDTVPILALASADRAPAIFLDHADHSFWLGAGVCNVIANMRESGRRISIERRGIDPGRIALLPTILDPRPREMSREAAKRRLRLPEDCVLMCSVARARKYRPIAGITYADLHLKTLLEHKQSILLVVGPGDREDWSDAHNRSDGRVIAIAEQNDPSVYLQAADIYLDSFPFVSITSLLEAGSYGTPAVSLYPYSDACRVMGSDMPGLDGALLTCRTIQEYGAVLSKLITDEPRRLRLGEDLRAQITREHTNGKWMQALNGAYDLARRSPYNEPETGPDQMSLGEPDIYIQAIHGGDPDGEKDTERLMRIELGVLPFDTRLREWWRLLRADALRDGGRYGPAIHLIPEWARCRAGRLRRRVWRAARS